MGWVGVDALLWELRVSRQIQRWAAQVCSGHWQKGTGSCLWEELGPFPFLEVFGAENPSQQQRDLLVHAGLGPGFGLARVCVLGEKGLCWVSNV